MNDGYPANKVGQWMHPTTSEIYDSMAQNGYSTDDEAWRERERLTLSSQARKDVTSMAKQMLRGKDRNHIARQLGVKEPTFKSKVNDGRFTAPEFVALAYLCGFEVKIEDKYQMILEGVLE